MPLPIPRAFRAPRPASISAGFWLLVALLASTYLRRNIGFSVDDSYITYRYALHFREGFGLVFNVGEAYYGTTAAGYAILLAAASALASGVLGLFGLDKPQWVDIPQVSVALSTAALVIVVAMLTVMARSRSGWHPWLMCALAAIFLFTSPDFNGVAGHETYPFLATALSGTIAIGYFRRYLTGGFLLAIATTFRPDAILFGGIVPVFDWWYSKLTLRDYLRSAPFLRFLGIYAVILIGWLAFLSLQFGSPVPGTMLAKKIQVALGYWPLYTPATIWKFLVSGTGYIGLTILAAGIFGLVREFKAPSADSDVRAENLVGGVWLVFGLLNMSAYCLLNVTFWKWYGVPIVFSFLVAAFAGWLKIDRAMARMLSDLRLRSDPGAMALRTAPAGLLFLLILANGGPVWQWLRQRNVNSHIAAYSEMVDYIHGHSPGPTTILMAEPGSFGYHLGPQYTVVDELGLISPGVAQALANKDYTWALKTYKPDYVICSWDGVYSACRQGLDENPEFRLVGEFNQYFWKDKIGRGAKLFVSRSAKDAAR